ncbi:hypothetical protein PQR67_16880 [Paraburkholderia fungorum]|uniref:hypothetical protein n=1 Tax=Paraburkholderia fungorum TaxID=134537 RepID=UPI0038BBB460
MPPIESRSARDAITILLERIHRQNAIPMRIGSADTDSDADAARLERIGIGARANKAVENMSVTTSLDPVEKEVLLFWLIVHRSSQLRDALAALGQVTSNQLISIVAGALLRPFALVAHAMREDGPLRTSSLIKLSDATGEALRLVRVSAVFLDCTASQGQPSK